MTSFKAERKNPQFSSNLADIQTKLLTHEAIILTKFHKECKKIVDFLLRQNFLAFALFYASVNGLESLNGTPNFTRLSIFRHHLKENRKSFMAKSSLHTFSEIEATIL